MMIAQGSPTAELTEAEIRELFERSLAVQPEDDVRVANVDGEKHGFASSTFGFARALVQAGVSSVRAATRRTSDARNDQWPETLTCTIRSPAASRSQPGPAVPSQAYSPSKCG